MKSCAKSERGVTSRLIQCVQYLGQVEAAADSHTSGAMCVDCTRTKGLFQLNSPGDAMCIDCTETTGLLS
jgi:hypothetical protein